MNEEASAAKVILFGGGDGGGIRITPSGAEPIPPFAPALRLQLRALNALIRSGHHMREKEYSRLLGGITTKLMGAVLTQVELLVGEIDGDNGLVYQDEDGGFTCGSTGKPPLPFPWPVDPRKTAEEVISRGILDSATISFLEQAVLNKMDVFSVAQDPQRAAEIIGINLTPEIEKSLLTFNLDKVEVEDPLDNEVIEFYRNVIHDGRFISEWIVNPAVVAKRLNVKVSKPALERIVATRDFGLMQPGVSSVGCGAFAVAVAIAIVIVLWSHEVDLPVFDRSGIQKL